MKTGHLPYLLLILFLSGADESTSDETAGVHQSPELSPGQQFQGLNATVKLRDGESMKGGSEELDPMQRLSQSRKGGSSGGKGAGGRSVGGGGSQAAREPRLELRSDAPSILWSSFSSTQLIFLVLLVSVLFF